MVLSLQSLDASDAKTVEEEGKQTGRGQRWLTDASREGKGRQWKSKEAGEREKKEKARGRGSVAWQGHSHCLAPELAHSRAAWGS